MQNKIRKAQEPRYREQDSISGNKKASRYEMLIIFVDQLNWITNEP
jgi:hypothetical protein